MSKQDLGAMSGPPQTQVTLTQHSLFCSGSPEGVSVFDLHRPEGGLGKGSLWTRSHSQCGCWAAHNSCFSLMLTNMLRMWGQCEDLAGDTRTNSSKLSGVIICFVWQVISHLPQVTQLQPPSNSVTYTAFKVLVPGQWWPCCKLSEGG